MEQAVQAYFDKFIQLLKSVEITLDRGTPLGLAEGIHQTIALMRKRSGQGGKLIFIGNGGSASIASHFALDFWHAGGMRSVTFSDHALLTCLSNDLGFEQVYSRPVSFFADPGDVLVAISSSGRSQNILNAVSAARGRDCAVVTLSGFLSDNPLRKTGDINYYVAAEHFGIVESIHKTLLHAILDLRDHCNDHDS